MEALLMLNVRTGLRFGVFLLGTFLVVALAGPAFAGNVYSWVTEDGTYSFTDDSKRIPAKHRSEAKKRSLGKLSRYERFTEISSEKTEPYAERVRSRRDQLRQTTVTAPQGVVAGAVVAQSGPTTDYTAAVTGGTTRAGRSGVSMRFPLGPSASADDDEPTTIESRRMDPSDSLATRHWTFVKKGDRIVTVIKGERRQRSLQAISESDFDF